MEKTRYVGRAVPYSVSLPTDLIAALRERAILDDLPVSRIIRRAVARELADKGRRAGDQAQHVQEVVAQ